MTDHPLTLPLPPALIAQLQETPQNPRYHAEGNVYNHVLLVMQQFEQQAPALDLSPRERDILYWAVLLHDAGKPAVTRWEHGRWTAQGHELAGLPIARELLLRQSPLDAAARQQVLELVKWHHIPLQWGLRSTPYDAYLRLATQTDLRLLGIFAGFDLAGRICEQQDAVLDLIRRFNEDLVPRIAYELGSYADLQTAFRQASFSRQNALWHALSHHDIRLLLKLLQREAPRPAPPHFRCVLTLGLPEAGQADWTAEFYPGYTPYDCAQLPLAAGSTHDMQQQYRQLYHFISVYGQARKPIALTGLPLDPALRQPVTRFIRQQGGHMTGLFFDRIPAACGPETLPQAWAQLDLPHPWEMHQLELIG